MLVTEPTGTVAGLVFGIIVTNRQARDGMQPTRRISRQQPLDGHASGLATFGDRPNDIRCQIAEPQNPADMSLI